MALSPVQLKLHNEAVELCSKHRRLEAEIIRVLIAIDREKLFKRLGYSSLFVYSVKALGLSEANAYSYIAVARKCVECPQLKTAVAEASLSVSKAARMASAMTRENAGELVAYGMTHTSREIDREMVRRCPKNVKTGDRVRPLSADRAELRCAISFEVERKLKRAQSVLSTKLGRAADMNETIGLALDAFLEKHDPVVKAQKAQAKRAGAQGTEKFCPSRVGKRKPLTAEQKHTIMARDEGRCTFIDPDTRERCTNDRWVHIHHKRPVLHGGGNDPENLQTLCSTHHDLVHQLCLPLDGQVTLLRAQRARYG